VQCISTTLFREHGCVNSQLIRDLGWALYTFSAKDEELVRLLLQALETVVEHNDLVFPHSEEFVDSIVPVLCRFLISSNQDSKTLSLSLLRLLLPGLFVHLSATGSTSCALLVRLCSQQLLPSLAPLLKQPEPIAQYTLLLVSELAGATGNVYGVGLRSVWPNFSSSLVSSEASDADPKFIDALMARLAHQSQAADDDEAEDDGAGCRVLANCLRLLCENGFKEEVGGGAGGDGVVQLPPVVDLLFRKSFTSLACRALKNSLSREDPSGVLAWVNCLKCVIAIVTSSIPAARGDTGDAPLASPPPSGKGEDAWGSSILSPGDMARMRLKGEGGGEEGRSWVDACRNAVEEVATQSVVFTRCLGLFSETKASTRAIEDGATWILSAVATVAGTTCFSALFQGRAGGADVISRFHIVCKGGLAGAGGDGGERAVVRCLRVCTLGEATALAFIKKDAPFMATLKELGVGRGGEVSDEVVALATRLLKRGAYSSC
jgi:hypothetical protein